MNTNNPFTEGDGYILLENVFPAHIIDSINEKIPTLYPVRASSADKHYAEGEKIKELSDISVWWSQLTVDWTEVQIIDSYLHEYMSQYAPNQVLYTSDIVTISGDSKWVNPHVDTPHRFDKWNEDERLLGIQCIVALQDTTPEMGVTGLVPNSYVRNWDIHQCYDGVYNKYFWDNFEQVKMSKGSVLLYNCRILHSSMPNYLSQSRPMLLLNYLDSDIVEEVKVVDNIWKSNAKHS
jgi:hypothetical protein